MVATTNNNNFYKCTFLKLLFILILKLDTTPVTPQFVSLARWKKGESNRLPERTTTDSPSCYSKNRFLWMSWMWTLYPNFCFPTFERMTESFTSVVGTSHYYDEKGWEWRNNLWFFFFLTTDPRNGEINQASAFTVRTQLLLHSVDPVSSWIERAF